MRVVVIGSCERLWAADAAVRRRASLASEDVQNHTAHLQNGQSEWTVLPLIVGGCAIAGRTLRMSLFWASLRSWCHGAEGDNADFVDRVAISGGLVEKP